MRNLTFILGLFFISQVSFSAEGPKIFYEHDTTLLNTTIQVVVLTGSSDDPPKMRGLSNLLGEMLLRGTRKRSRNEFQSAVERLGATVSVRTSHDKTTFVGAVIKENTKAFMKLLEETLYSPSFSPKEFRALKKEVLADISHIKNSNMRLAGLALRREIFKGTVFERSGMGSISTVKGIKIKNLLNVYNKQFRRGNFVFAVASPLPQSMIQKRIERFWKKFKKSERRVVKTYPLKLSASPKLILVHKPKTSTGSIFFGQAGITAQDPSRYILGAGNFSFGGEPLVSRLFRTVRSELGWTYSVGSTYHAMGALSDQKGLYVITSTPSVEFTSKTIFKVLAMWKKYLKSGVTKKEINLAQDSLVNSYPFEFDSARKRLWHQLRSYIYNVPILSPEQYAKEIRGIDNSKIKKALNEKHTKQGWIISLVADANVIKKQLAEAQKNVPEKKQLKISQTLTPDSLIQ